MPAPVPLGSGDMAKRLIGRPPAAGSPKQSPGDRSDSWYLASILLDLCTVPSKLGGSLQHEHMLALDMQGHLQPVHWTAER